MEVKQIESFYWVGKLGSFSAAAQYLNTTQPNISTRIQALERELGASLFDRSARQIHLTSAGRDLAPLAEEVIRAISAMKARARGGNALAGRIRLGVTNTVAHTWLADLIKRVQADHPAVDIDFHVDTNATLRKRFAEHSIDLLVCTEQIREAGYASEFLFQSGFEWVAPMDMDIEPEPVSAQRLAEQRIITYPTGSDLHKRVVDYFRQDGLSPDRMSGSNSLPAMLSMVAGSAGICAIPSVILADQGQAPRIRRLTVERRLPDINFFVSYAEDPLNRALPVMATLIKQVSRSWLEDKSGI